MWSPLSQLPPSGALAPFQTAPAQTAPLTNPAFPPQSLGQTIPGLGSAYHSGRTSGAEAIGDIIRFHAGLMSQNPREAMSFFPQPGRALPTQLTGALASYQGQWDQLRTAAAPYWPTVF